MCATNSSNGGPLKKRLSGLRKLRLNKIAAQWLLLAILSCGVAAQSVPFTNPGPKPGNPSEASLNWVGDYSNGAVSFTVGEDHGELFVVGALIHKCVMPPAINDLSHRICESNFSVSLLKSPQGQPALLVQKVSYTKLSTSTGTNGIGQIKPVRPVDELRREALAAAPPAEKGPFRNTDLVEVAPLDPAIRLDIRYATSNDFLGTPVYTQARAFLQRPAAEALIRALHRLQPLGYGLLIHDAYRPWYVTKIFWEATPQEGKIFVADPAQGSRHNRGCAVDLTLYDLKIGNPIEMTGTYDEMSPRSYPNYPGGTSLQRWHRDLLRWAMESEDFTVYEYEWWHFDYKDWREYAIGNTPFEKLDIATN